MMPRPSPLRNCLLTLIAVLSCVAAMTGHAANTTDIAEARPMTADPDIEQAIQLMDAFAARTGLTTGGTARRYLWTDAFALCNWLGLALASGDPRHQQLALRLVDQVHRTLGRHRDDDPRRGWISGLGEQEGAAHPTRGGLRIGKELPERRPHDAFDHQLEWERDGQYFHYLTKWMHALNQASRATGDPRFNGWARELAVAAHDAFTYRPPRSPVPQMYWKMSIDLSHPLVSSMGQHDPLDGLLTVAELQATATELGQAGSHGLATAGRDFATMLEHAELATPDPLGIGGLLADAYRTAQLRHRSKIADDDLLERLLEAAHRGLQAYAASGELQAPAAYRLAFRELGLAIGLRAVQRLQQESAQAADLGRAARMRLGALMGYAPLGEDIVRFWRDPANRKADSWTRYRDINEVMLATALAPEGFLVRLPLR